MKKTVLALGSDTKNRFLLSGGRSLLFGPDIQDLSNAENYALVRKEVQKALKKVMPKLIACDMHPGYFSSSLAKEISLKLPKSTLLAFQHHHAHIASVIYEHGLKEPVIGVSFDGTGYGTDGNIWGGEFFTVRGKHFKRVAHLKYQMLPGGDKAVLEPWRMVLSILGKSGLSAIKEAPKEEKFLVLKMLEKGLNSPLSSSAGRLFDAAAALLGICEYASYEAEGPIKLESLCSKKVKGSYPFDLADEKGLIVVDPKKIFLALLEDKKKEKSKETIATKFHNSMIKIIIETVKKISKESGIKNTVLSGGVFQNGFLRERCIKELVALRFKVFTNNKAPVNDLNVALGQYYMALNADLN